MLTYRELQKIINPLYQVGGSIRDELMGSQPTDYDFATPLSPEEIESAIRKAGKRPYLTGKRFGTIGVKFEGRIVEITSFRTEQYEPGSRKPIVTYVADITTDLSRRDFTINAMAKDIAGKIIDPFHGQRDLDSRLIRTVGEPRERFAEDPLRLLRAARFVATLDFTLEGQTEVAMRELAHTILTISRERWLIELDKLLLSSKPSTGLEVLAQSYLLNYIIPELVPQIGYDQNSPHHSFELWEHTKQVVDGVEADIDFRWAALLHDVGKPYVRREKPDRSSYKHHDLLGSEMVIKIGHYLRWPTSRLTAVSNLVLTHLSNSSPLRKADNLAK